MTALRALCILQLLFVLHPLSASAEDCCGLVVSNSSCHSQCVEVLSEDADSLTPVQTQTVSNACPSTYVDFWKCFNRTTADQHPELYCCEVENAECRQVCREVLINPNPNRDEILSLLLGACGENNLIDGIFQCFLNPTTAPPPVDELKDVDWARIPCCYKAIADECRESCLLLHSSRVTPLAWRTFQIDCMHRPSENDLRTCIYDVAAPCTLGCSGLNFCSAFNNRPTESFRYCTTTSDRMAKNDYHTWGNNAFIPLPFLEIEVDNVRECHPELWKAIACITYIQPCQSTTHKTQFCRDDCIRVLSDCGKKTNSTADPAVICNIIAPASMNDYCLPLSDYTSPSNYTAKEASLITHPCQPNPCARDYFCSVNHLCRTGDLTCSPYSCQPGCTVGGEAPGGLILPSGSVVKVPLITWMDDDEVNDNEECFAYFNCTKEPNALNEGKVELEFQYCERKNSCLVGNGTYSHQTTFWGDCNFCVCYYGRTICTKHSCSSPEGKCNCSAEYDPVCTQSGRTIPNSCTARCLGYSPMDYHTGACGSVDPCSSASCERGTRCLPNRRICFSRNERSNKCQQFTCEPVSQDCMVGITPDPVCDSSNRQHPNLCALLRTQEYFGYFGYCRTECSRVRSEQVCGVNGETFETRCHAESLHVAVDYNGPCKAVPQPGTKTLPCPDVACPALPNPGCRWVIPYDSCCPKCGTHVTILMDKESMYRNSEDLGRAGLTSTGIMKRLRHYISSLQCDLYGHVTTDDTLSILVLPVVNSTGKVVIDVCNQEAVRLATLINTRTPAISSDPLLSHLVFAHMDSLRSGPVDPDKESGETEGVLFENGGRRSCHSLDFFLVTFALLVSLFVSGNVYPSQLQFIAR